jgi:hypothetical protein
LGVSPRIPDPNTPVWVQFMDGDLNYPVWTGTWNPQPPEPPPVSPLYSSEVASGPFTMAQSAAWRSMPVAGGGPLITTLDVDVDTLVLVLMNAYMDTTVNNNRITLSVDFSGATVNPAGAYPEQDISTGAKSSIAATLSISFVIVLNAGTTTAEIKYQAQVNGGSTSNLAITLINLGVP